MKFLGVTKWCSANVFSNTRQKHVYFKMCIQSQKGFWLCYGSILFSMSSGFTLFSMSSELRLVKWVRFFEQNSIVKWVIFFASFCWLWDFLLEKLKLKKNSDDAHWNMWTNMKKLYGWNNIFQKRNSKHEILNHLYFGPNFVF